MALIGRNIAVFMAKMGMRLVGMPKDVVPPVELPKSVRREAVKRGGKTLAVAGLAGAFAFLLANKTVREKIVGFLRETKSATARIETIADTSRDAVQGTARQ